MIKGCAAAGAAVLILAAGVQARAAVTVIGGGLAEACSKAAIRGEKDSKFQELCTTALETEFLNARDRAGTYPAASQDFNQAVRIKPDMGEAYVNRGAASIGQRRYAESLADINKGIELGLNEPAKAYYNRALAYEGLEDAKSAYFDYQKAIELQPEWTAPREQLTRFTVARKSGS
jgi:tetratricopeptide (TPR) repeat protein